MSVSADDTLARRTGERCQRSAGLASETDTYIRAAGIAQMDIPRFHRGHGSSSGMYFQQQKRAERRDEASGSTIGVVPRHAPEA
jgi:hypothetical protein